MLKKTIIFLTFILPFMLFAQDYSNLWKGYFSYNKVKDIVVGKDKIYGASENTIFTFDTKTNELEEISTINGLSGEAISTIYYSEIYDLLVVGYQNGLIDIVFDNDDILTVVDIVNKATIADGNKKINHITASNNYVYLATGYGISVFDLERLEFGDTYFIGDLGAQIEVRQIALFGEYIYAACRNGGGVRRALIASPNLIDYNNWEVIHTAEFYSLQVNKNKLFAVAFNKWAFEISNGEFRRLFLLPDISVKTSSVDEKLIVTTRNDVFIYDVDFNLLSQISDNEEFNTNFNAATLVDDNIYIGTNDFGVLSTSISNPIDFEEIHPDGPLLNSPFSIEAEQNGGIWVTYGAYDLFYNPYGFGLNNRGVSHLNNGDWINTKYEDLFGARELNTITINPNNPKQVFISSFFNGLLEFVDDEPFFLYNQTNSGLESLKLPGNPNYIDIRVSGAVFDNNGVLWTVTSRVDTPLKAYNLSSNKWNAYNFDSLLGDVFDNLGFQDLIIDNNNTKWISSSSLGIIAFNENNGNPLLKNISEFDGNLPTETVRAIAMDNSNQLWIGTDAGLRVLYNTSSFFTDENIAADEIIILEDGIAKELLENQFISDIKVDGSNNKWISTIGSGVFYLSSNGQETIYHFTTDNSPLPSNDINDISIDETNGLIYFGTSNGLVSFKSGGSKSTENLETVYAYPNPVRPNFDIVEKKFKIKNISENVNIKITDIEGNLVAEAQSGVNLRYNNYNLEIDGGTVFWNGKNMANNIVASGVYLIMISDLDTFETKVIKLMVVR